MDILTEGDPGLRKKRAAILEHLTLSQILREAKEKASGPSEISGEQLPPGPIYGQLLEDYQGLQHVEALEMLSKQSSARLRRMRDLTAKDPLLDKSLEEIKSICGDISVPSQDDPKAREDFETLVRRHMLEVDLPFSIESLLQYLF
ncbi:protein FAM114A2-like [Uloborus diversus]|uniref:protein FAM114A2-like n=1 Tax=Uloborus diversus TaxID=327109 RepID=UPI00240A64A7|nr:protein FAM114A2-like [Uloborus diversus]